MKRPRHAIACFALCAALAAILAASGARAGDTTLIALHDGLTTEIIEIWYVPAEHMAEMITPFLTPQGSAIPDPTTNVLIVTDTPGNMARIHDIILRLDNQQPQIRITAQLVKAGNAFLNTLGVHWNSGADFGPGYSSVVIHDNQAQLNAEIEARQRRHQVHSDSQITVTTLALARAEIALGSSLPIPGSHGSTEFHDVVVRLGVTPRVMGGNRLRLTLDIQGDSTNNPMQGIDISAVTTTVDVLSGQTVAVGSGNTASNSSNNNGTPGAADTPLLGYAFSTRESGNSLQSLVIFITAEIL